MDRTKTGDPDGEALPAPSMTANVLAALILELETTDPGLAQRLEARLRSECARANVVRIRAAWPEALVRQEIDRAAKWLGVVAVLIEAELGPLSSRLRRKKGR